MNVICYVVLLKEFVEDLSVSLLNNLSGLGNY